MCHQGTCRHTHLALRALHPPTQSILLGGGNPRHSPYVRRLRKSYRSVTEPSGHAHHIWHVCTETDPFKELCEDVERPLQPLYQGRCNQPVIRIEERRQLLDGLPKSLRSRLCRRHHHHQVTDHGVHHHHVENLGGQGSPWFTPLYPWKGGTKYPPYFATIHNRVQYVHKSQSVRGPMPYPARMSRHRSCSRAS